MALKSPSPEVTKGLLAVQLQFLQYGQPSQTEDLARLASLDENDLGQRVIEVGGDRDKAICCKIIDLYGSESILPEDVAKMAS